MCSNSAGLEQAVLASGGVAHLLAALSSQDEAVVLAASRALKMVYQVCLLRHLLASKCAGPVQHRA